MLFFYLPFVKTKLLDFELETRSEYTWVLFSFYREGGKAVNCIFKPKHKTYTKGESKGGKGEPHQMLERPCLARWRAEADSRHSSGVSKGGCMGPEQQQTLAPSIDDYGCSL